MDRAQALQNDIRRQDELIEQAWAQLKQVEQVRWDLIRKLNELCSDEKTIQRGREMSTERSRLVDKVRKLLAMANHENGNANEVAIALRQAEAMMRKHEIKYAEVTLSQLTADNLCEAASEIKYKKTPEWVWSLAWSAALLTDTRPSFCNYDAYGRHNISFCGSIADTEVALLIFEYLITACKRLTKTYLASSAAVFLLPRLAGGCFRSGFADSISYRAQHIALERRQAFESETSGKSLVEMKETLIESTFNLEYCDPEESGEPADMRSYHSGTLAGKNLSLNDQLDKDQNEAIGRTNEHA